MNHKKFSFKKLNFVFFRELTEKGHTVMCVIHQPSSQVYHLFDRLLLLVEGRTAFLGNVKDAQQLFEQ